MRREQGSDDDRRDESIAEHEAHRRAQQERDPRGDETEADGPALGLPKERQVDLQTGDEHEQQLSQLRQELRNRPLFPEDAKHMGPDDDPAEQQSHHGREPDATRRAVGCRK